MAACCLCASGEVKAQKRTNRIGVRTVQEDDTTGGVRARHIVDSPMRSMGMLNVYMNHRGACYLEIPDSLLHRDMLFGSRVCSISDNARISAGQRRSNPVLIQFERRDNMIVLLKPDVESVPVPGDATTPAFDRNHAVPAVMAFDIAERGAANRSSVIDVSKLFSGEVPLVWPAGVTNGAGRIEPKLTRIVMAKAFAKNVEIKSEYGFVNERNPMSLTVQCSLVLLPKSPYRMRYADPRIGISNDSRKIFATDKSGITQRFIHRWHVCEGHPIIFYVDTLMPEKWRRYVREGIEGWNDAFARVGIKNAIKAADYPRGKFFDADDSRYNCFKYVPSTEANAQGSHWIDPRSGEIVQGEILWWSSVIDKLRTWLFVQTAAADQDVRGEDIPDETLGAAIRYATAHEMGHVLGFQHNMRGSYAYPTDSLRSASFTQKYGTTASIMDYARNNYVAQPGDKEKGVYLYPPKLGPYDYFLVKYAYQPVEHADTPDDEVSELNRWFTETKNNPMYGFAPAMVSTVLEDPSGQSDALGDDLVKTATYAQSNVKYLLENLVRWTLKPNDPLDRLKERYDEILKFFERVTTLPISYIGGQYNYQGTYGQRKNMNVAVSKAMQKKTIDYLFRVMHAAPSWIAPSSITALLGRDNGRLVKWQEGILDDILGNTILQRVMDNTSSTGYTPDEYLKDVDDALWRTTTSGPLTAEARNLQMKYVERLLKMASATMSSDPKTNDPTMNSRIWSSVVYGRLMVVGNRLRALSASGANRAHYGQMLRLIRKNLS